MNNEERDTLFSGNHPISGESPLAAILRPSKLADIVGHDEVIKQGGLLSSIVASGKILSILIAGPPGTGKTTIARLIASEMNARLVSHIATSFGVKDIKEIVSQAEQAQTVLGLRTIVFIDEIHRLTKVQSDALLAPVEDGKLYLFGATTENPWISVSPALLSRMTVVELRPLRKSDIESVIGKASEFTKMSVDDSVFELLFNLSGGDLRVALNLFEAATVIASSRRDGSRSMVTSKDILAVRSRVSKGFSASEHFEMTSALIKSMRASNPDAALYWLARLLVAGEDPRYIARRLVVFASEDIGLDDSQALLVADATANAVDRIGMPEVRINLGHCVAYLSKSPKSRVSYDAINFAMEVASKTTHLGVPQGVRGGIEEIERRNGREHVLLKPKEYFPSGLSATKFLRD